MATVRLTGDASGYTELSAPNAAGNNKLVLPTGNGVDEQYLQTNGSGTLTWNDPFRLKQGTAVASTSGTSIDFTGIPSWVKRVTVMFNGVSTNGSSNYLIQLGDSGGIEATGYAASGSGMDSTVATSTYTTGFGIRAGNASNSLSGHAVITLESSNSWICSGVMSSALGLLLILAGSKSLSGTLDRIRITTINGTDTFDAGTINILYEG